MNRLIQPGHSFVQALHMHAVKFFVLFFKHKKKTHQEYKWTIKTQQLEKEQKSHIWIYKNATHKKTHFVALEQSWRRKKSWTFYFFSNSNRRKWHTNRILLRKDTEQIITYKPQEVTSSKNHTWNHTYSTLLFTCISLQSLVCRSH